MRYHRIRGLFYVLASLALHPNWAFGAEADAWEDAFQRLCSYDSRCPLLKIGERKGADFQPLEEATFLALTEGAYLQDVLAAGLEYGISPALIAGTILAEHSLNISISDSLQTALASQGITNVLGREFSFGFGQISMDRARGVEPFAAGVETRELRTDREIIDAVISERGSIFYVAALLKEAGIEYASAAEEFDNPKCLISDRPEILATLYNLGKVARKARRTCSKSGRGPRMNYFGFFVWKNWEALQAAYD